MLLEPLELLTNPPDPLEWSSAIRPGEPTDPDIGFSTEGDHRRSEQAKIPSLLDYQDRSDASRLAHPEVIGLDHLVELEQTVLGAQDQGGFPVFFGESAAGPMIGAEVH